MITINPQKTVVELWEYAFLAALGKWLERYIDHLGEKFAVEKNGRFVEATYPRWGVRVAHVVQDTSLNGDVTRQIELYFLRASKDKKAGVEEPSWVMFEVTITPDSGNPNAVVKRTELVNEQFPVLLLGHTFAEFDASMSRGFRKPLPGDCRGLPTLEQLFSVPMDVESVGLRKLNGETEWWQYLHALGQKIILQGIQVALGTKTTELENRAAHLRISSTDIEEELAALKPALAVKDSPVVTDNTWRQWHSAD